MEDGRRRQQPPYEAAVLGLSAPGVARTEAPGPVTRSPGEVDPYRCRSGFTASPATRVGSQRRHWGESLNGRDSLSTLLPVPLRRTKTPPVETEVKTCLMQSDSITASTAYAGGFPQLQQHSLQQYLHLFSQLDSDGDGSVQGKECFGIFMQWGLPRQVLKDVWQVVAGDEPTLSQQRFVSCLYLMDLAKQGRPVPSQLPTGVFPPGFRSGSDPATQPAPSAAPAAINLGSMQQVQHDVFSNDLPTPQLPRKAEFRAPRGLAAPRHAPLPSSEGMADLDPLQRQRLQNDAGAAEKAEKELAEAEARSFAAAAKERFFREALQELTLFKSRTSAALLQAQEQLASASAEADAMEERYSEAWTTAQTTQSKSTALLEQLSQAKGRKLEATRRLEELQKDIQSMSSITEDQVDAEQQAVALLLKDVAKLEAEKEARVMEQEVLLQGRMTLQEELTALKNDLAAATSVVESTDKELEALLQQLEGGEDSAGLQLQTCLRKTQAAHKTLVEHAKKHGITVPDADDEDDEEMANVPESFAWPHYVMVGAQDWDAEMKPPTIVDELSDESRLLDPTLEQTPTGRDASESGGIENGQESKAAGAEVTNQDAWAAF